MPIDQKVISKLIKDLNSFTPVGSNHPVAMLGSEVEEVKAIPCFTPALAYLLSIGGWPEGKLIQLSGKEHSGKTSFAIMGLKDCYDYYNGERAVAYIDLEHRFNPKWAATLGLNVGDNLIVLQPPDAETATDMMVTLIKSKQVCAIAFDSIGAAATKHSMQQLTDKNDRVGGNAAVMKRNVQTIAPLANLFDVTCFYINQLRDDLTGYNQITVPGGRAPKHAMSVHLYLRPGNKEYKYYDKINGVVEQVGNAIVMKTLKNSYGPAFREGWTDFYNQPCTQLDHVGIDIQKDLARMGILLGVAKKSGSWFTWKDIKAQGREGFFEALWASGKREEFEAEINVAIREHTEMQEVTDEDAFFGRPLTDPEEDVEEIG